MKCRKKKSLILVYSEENTRNKLTLTSSCVLVPIWDVLGKFRNLLLSFIRRGQGWKLRTSEGTDHSAIEDDLTPKIGLIRPFVHCHMKIDNKRYSINAQSPRAISTCLENKPVFKKSPPLSPVWEPFAIQTGHDRWSGDNFSFSLGVRMQDQISPSWIFHTSPRAFDV